jgi:hypothetical protein
MSQGLELSRAFYRNEVLPIVEKHFKALRHSAALLGPGSEVLGYDTEISRDHHWGPRVLLFLSESDYPQLQSQISQALSQELPTQFMGYSTNFSEPESNGVRHAVAVDHGPVNHLAEIFTIRSFFGGCLKFDPYREPSAADWLAFPQQRLLELTRGEVFHDGLEELNPIRKSWASILRTFGTTCLRLIGEGSPSRKRFMGVVAMPVMNWVHESSRQGSFAM